MNYSVFFMNVCLLCVCGRGEEERPYFKYRHYLSLLIGREIDSKLTIKIIFIAHCVSALFHFVLEYLNKNFRNCRSI